MGIAAAAKDVVGSSTVDIFNIAIADTPEGFFGKTIQYEYSFDDNPYDDYPPSSDYPQIVTVGDHVEVAQGLGPQFSVDITANKILIDYHSDRFSESGNSSYSGPIVGDIYNQVDPIRGVSFGFNNMVGLTTERLFYNENQVFVNWVGLSSTANTYVEINVFF